MCWWIAWLAINCTVTSVFDCWLGNRYLFCLNQIYRGCYSHKNAFGTTHIYVVKPKFYVKNGFAVNWAKVVYILLSRNLYGKKLNMPWCILKKRIWEALRKAAGTHLSQQKADKPRALCFGWWTLPSMTGCCSYWATLAGSWSELQLFLKSPGGTAHCTGLFSGLTDTLCKMFAWGQDVAVVKTIIKACPWGVCSCGNKALQIHMDHSVSGRKENT